MATVGVHLTLYGGQVLTHLSHFSCRHFSPLFLSVCPLLWETIYTSMINFPLLLRSIHTYHFPLHFFPFSFLFSTGNLTLV